MNSANVQRRVFDVSDLCSEGGLNIRYSWSLGRIYLWVCNSLSRKQFNWSCGKDFMFLNV